MDSPGSGKEPLTGCCEHGNELLCYTKCGELLLASHEGICSMEQTFMTLFTKPCHSILTQCSRLKSIHLCPSSLISILILSSHLRIHLPSGVLHYISHVKSLCVFISPHMHH